LPFATIVPAPDVPGTPVKLTELAPSTVTPLRRVAVERHLIGRQVDAHEAARAGAGRDVQAVRALGQHAVAVRGHTARDREASAGDDDAVAEEPGTSTSWSAVPSVDPAETRTPLWAVWLPPSSVRFLSPGRRRGQRERRRARGRPHGDEVLADDRDVRRHGDREGLARADGPAPSRGPRRRAQ
jgi:hypothetical protein